MVIVLRSLNVVKVEWQAKKHKQSDDWQALNWSPSQTKLIGLIMKQSYKITQTVHSSLQNEFLIQLCVSLQFAGTKRDYYWLFCCGSGFNSCFVWNVLCPCLFLVFTCASLVPVNLVFPSPLLGLYMLLLLLVFPGCIPAHVVPVVPFLCLDYFCTWIVLSLLFFTAFCFVSLLVNLRCKRGSK